MLLHSRRWKESRSTHLPRVLDLRDNALLEEQIVVLVELRILVVILLHLIMQKAQHLVSENLLQLPLKTFFFLIKSANRGTLVISPEF